MSNRLHRLWSDAGGATAVEFAMVAPVFVAMLIGVFQLGWALHCNQSVDYALNIAGRSLVSNPSMSQSDLQTHVQSLLTNIADPDSVTVTLTEDPAGSSPRLAHMTASYAHTVSVPLVTGFSYTYQTSSSTLLNP